MHDLDGLPDVLYPNLFITWRFTLFLTRVRVRYLGLGLVLVLGLGVSVRVAG